MSMRVLNKFPFYKQYNQTDCGAACLLMVTKFYNRSYSLHNLRSKVRVGRNGTSLVDLSDAAESTG